MAGFAGGGGLVCFGGSGPLGGGDVDTLEGVDGEGVKELVGYNEGHLLGGCYGVRGWPVDRGKGVRTVGDGLDGVCPDDGNIHVFTDAVIADLGLSHGGVFVAKKGLLGFSQLGTSLYHVNGINAISHGREVLNGLVVCVSEVSLPVGTRSGNPLGGCHP